MSSCGNDNIIKNGTNKCGNPQYHCKDCGIYCVLKPKEHYSEATREQVLRAAQERVSLHGLEWIFKVSRQTIAKWVREYVKPLPVVADTLLLYEVGDVLEMDKLWLFVLDKDPKRWVWIAHFRHTCQIVTFYIGKRNEDAARQLEQRILTPLCPMYTDGYSSYTGILSDHLHWATQKNNGATSHLERWNNTLRQRLARFVCKALSFSKCDVMHYIMLEWFIIEHNLQAP